MSHCSELDVTVLKNQQCIVRVRVSVESKRALLFDSHRVLFLRGLRLVSQLFAELLHSTVRFAGLACSEKGKVGAPVAGNAAN